MPQLDPNCLKLSEDQRSLLKQLISEYVPSSEVWAYGSRITEHNHEGSDLDLVLRNPSALEVPVRGSSDLKEAISASSLPMLIDIHQWAYLPESFKQNIEQAYVLLKG